MSFDDSLPWTPLHEAARTDDVKAATRLVTNRANVHATSGYDENEDVRQPTPLHIAAARGSVGVAELLLKAGAQIEALALHYHGGDGERYHTPLELACSNGKLATAKLLIDAGANLSPHNGMNSYVSVTENPMCSAITNGHVEIVRLLLDAEVDPNTVAGSLCENPRPLLATALAAGRMEIARLLVGAGADVNPDPECYRFADIVPPLSIAAVNGQVQVMEFLASNGAKLDLPGGQGPLRYASEAAQPEAIEFLISSGVNPAVTDFRGNTFLHACINPQHTRMRWQWSRRSPGEGGERRSMQLLHDAGIDVNAANVAGQTPLHAFAGRRRDDLPRVYAARWLIEARADLDRRDNEGRSPLMLAAAERNSKAAQLLVFAGAPVSSVDLKGCTAFHHLFSSRYSFRGASVIIKSFFAAGASPFAADADGNTVLHVACQCGNAEAVRVLLKHGADRHAKNQAGQTPLALAAEVRYGGEQLRESLATYFPVTLQVWQLVVGLRVSKPDENSLGRMASHPLFDSSVLQYVSCFASGQASSAFDQEVRRAYVYYHSTAVVADVAVVAEEPAVEEADSVSTGRPQKKTRVG